MIKRERRNDAGVSIDRRTLYWRQEEFYLIHPWKS